MFKAWRQKIYDDAFHIGRNEGLTEGFHEGLKIGYKRGFADGSKGGININEYGVFICKDAEHFETIITAKDNNEVDE